MSHFIRLTTTGRKGEPVLVNLDRVETMSPRTKTVDGVEESVTLLGFAGEGQITVRETLAEIETLLGQAATPQSGELPALEQTCQECGGTGFVQAPAWAQWQALVEQEARVSGLAIPEAAQRIPTPDGPEEIPCDACDGQGSVPTEAGYAVLNLVRVRGDGE